MDSGHVDGSISKNKYKSCIVPEGLGLWRVGGSDYSVPPRTPKWPRRVEG